MFHPRPPVCPQQPTEEGKLGRLTEHTTAVDAASKRAADRSHVCHHKPSGDYCTERLYNSEVKCCTCNIT